MCGLGRSRPPTYKREVEQTNSIILQGLKPRILTQEGKDIHAWLSTQAGKWAAEVPSTLWSMRTTPNRSTNFTPFFMVYGVETKLPTDLQYGSPGVWAYQLDATEEDRRDTINLLKESIDTTIIRLARCQQGLRPYHAHRV
jgi:hypothetical protein